MMNPILYALAETPMKDTVGETFGERAGVAGSVTLLGMVAIFAVLTILWGVIEVLHQALNRSKQKDAPAAPAAKAAPAGSKHYEPGDVVEHKVFGRGTVLKVKPAAGDQIVEINFEKVGIKKTMANFAPLTKITTEE